MNGWIGGCLNFKPQDRKYLEMKTLPALRISQASVGEPDGLASFIKASWMLRLFYLI